MTKHLTVRIKTSEENPEDMEILARAIIDISAAFEKMAKSRMTERAILLLIHDQAKNVSFQDIKTILDIVPRLKDIYLKKIPSTNLKNKR